MSNTLNGMFDSSNLVLAKLLVEKFGVDLIVDLLLDKQSIVPCSALANGRFYRRRKEMLTPFGDPPIRPDPNGLHEQVKPHLVLQALGEAAENMSYSNWMGEKLEVAEEVIFRYCEEHDLPIEFITVKEEL